MRQAAFLTRDDARLALFDTGDGLPVLFQHGLGGDEAQVAQAFPDSDGLRRLTVECRGHGTSSLGSRKSFSIGMFAEDILAVADSRGIGRMVVGGISMGAAIALHLAHFHKDRVAALVLVRPAWTFAAAPENMAPIRVIADLIRSFAVGEARLRFASSKIAADLKEHAPDNLASLLGYFDRSNATEFGAVLAGIAADGTGVSEEAAAAIAVPTLVIGNRQDTIHPLSSARSLATAIPDAAFVEVAAKAADKARHLAETRTAIAQFLASQTIRSLIAS